ncbi:MAG: efflux RND transporter periplasmic adaptor subunit [Paracoccaceae bacterium]|nr:efflux RND transporter periplasmic adaptor subunit [Paracoccaceae bacterium]
MRPFRLILAVVAGAAAYALVVERDRIPMLLSSLPFTGGASATVSAVEARSASPGLAVSDKVLVASTGPSGAANDSPATDRTIESAEFDGPAVSVMVRRSTARDVESVIVLSGRTEASRFVNVRAEISGRVISTPLRAGSMVKTGQLLCELDPGSRNAVLQEARARLIDAQSRNEVSSRLAQKGYGSEAAAISDTAALESAKSAVRRAEIEIERLRIAAPFPGLLESDTAELGSLLQPGSSCATVVSLDPIKLVGHANELQIESLAVGSQALGRVASGHRIEGVVTFASRRADPVTRTYRVEVTAPNSALDIRDGATAEILVSLAAERGHLLPQSSLTLNDKGQLGVRTVDDISRVRFFPVKIIRDTHDGIWVNGLPDSVNVIVVGQEFVIEGRKVRPTFEAESS